MGEVSWFSHANANADGCNTGTATVGNMGALDRFNYTMMGMVNLAARCESGAKAYGAYIMVTEELNLLPKLREMTLHIGI